MWMFYIISWLFKILILFKCFKIISECDSQIYKLFKGFDKVGTLRTLFVAISLVMKGGKNVHRNEIHWRHGHSCGFQNLVTWYTHLLLPFFHPLISYLCLISKVIQNELYIDEKSLNILNRNFVWKSNPKWKITAFKNLRIWLM